MVPLTPDQLRRLADVIFDDELELRPEPAEPGPARAVPILSKTVVMNRLDLVGGPGSWSFDWEPVGDAVKGRLTVCGESRVDAGATTAEALAACGRRFGIGRYLEYLPELQGEWLGERWAEPPRWSPRAVTDAVERPGGPR